MNTMFLSGDGEGVLGEEDDAAGRDGDGFHLCSVFINQYTD